MMGAPGLLDGKGVTYVYKYSSNVWNGEDVLAGDNSSSISPKSFGNSLAISPNGLLAVIGSPLSLRGTDTTGAAQVLKKYIYKQDGQRWAIILYPVI